MIPYDRIDDENIKSSTVDSLMEVFLQLIKTHDNSMELYHYQREYLGKFIDYNKDKNK